MAINLTTAQIDRALPLVAAGLSKYLWLQEHRHASDLRADSIYRRSFNHFYRVRRSPEWQDKFYALLEANKARKVRFAEVLHALQQTTGRYEASFASKLLATVNPDVPVIDSVVLRNLNLRLPAYGSRDRAAQIERLHDSLVFWFRAFLATETGQYLVARFRMAYPSAAISEVKMVDLVLWQTRPNNALHGTGARVVRSGR